MKIRKTSFEKKLIQQHNRCFYCGCDLNYDIIEQDHIVPFSLSKNGTVKNLCLSCRSCNRQKGDKPINVFKEYLRQNYPNKLIRGMLFCEFIKLYYHE